MHQTGGTRPEPNAQLMTDTTQDFCAQLVEGGGSAFAAVPTEELERLVALVLGRIAAGHEALGDHRRGFFAHLGHIVANNASGVTAIAELAIEDLYLAYACAQRDPVALVAFEQSYLPELRAALAKMRIPRDRHDDARQLIWQKLFVGTNSNPRILDFAGRGGLKHWVRVTVVRSLLDDLRRNKRVAEPVADDFVLGIVSPDADPEMEHLKRLYRHEFRTAFEEAVVALSAEERNVLRCYYTESMTVDQIAAAFGIHRATAARRVARAREGLVAETRRRLGERLALSGDELMSVIRLIESNLHVSVQRILA